MKCVVCMADCLGRAKTCSALCRQTADLEYKRRHNGRRRRWRNSAYLQQKSRRRQARLREQRHRDPVWIAWRKAADARKLEREMSAPARAAARRMQREAADREREQAALNEQRECGTCGKTFLPKHRWQEVQAICSVECGGPIYMRRLWRQQFYNKMSRPGFWAKKLERDAQYKAKQRGIIQALRELGWIDEHLDIITTPTGYVSPRMTLALQSEARRAARDQKWAALRGATIFVDRTGIAEIVIVDRCEYQRGLSSRWHQRHRGDSARRAKRNARQREWRRRGRKYYLQRSLRDQKKRALVVAFKEITSELQGDS